MIEIPDSLSEDAPEEPLEETLTRFRQTTKSPYVPSEPLPPPDDDPRPIVTASVATPLEIPTSFSDDPPALEAVEATIDRMHRVTKSPYAVSDQASIGGFGLDFGLSFGVRQ